MSKLGRKYTEEVIKERAASIGYSVTHIDRTSVIPLVHLKCSRGHNRSVSAPSIKSATCQICEGKRMDKEKVAEYVNTLGITIIGDLPTELDRYGNEVIKAASTFPVLCSNGHTFNVNVSELRRGKECSKCAGKVRNIGFSRSEEIIARVLDYYAISYVRQYKLPDEYEGLLLDFYLPEYNIIIEYDGEQHVYGRSDDTEEDVIEIKRRDAIRDDYASDTGLTLHRITHSYTGRALVYALSEIFPTICPEDGVHDDIVREVFNESASRYEWNTYEEIKEVADTYLHNPISRAATLTGISPTVIARRFRTIYGMNKGDFIKKI